MLHTNVDSLDLEKFWSDDDPDVMHRGQWLVHSGTGAGDIAATYFEIDAGKRIGRHTHDAEETVVILAGAARLVVDDETSEASAGSVAHIARDVPHDVVNTGNDAVRAIGVFSKADVKTTFELPLQPDGEREMGSPG